ncbi:DUF3822 family protein [Sphingobacterium sp. KU25419]|nr:DUF3822 family protein [Sphingobacterium sp. KU25419]
MMLKIQNWKPLKFELTLSICQSGHTAPKFNLYSKRSFQEDRLSDYAPYLVEHVADHIHTYEMKNLGIVAVFEYDLILYNRWKALFPDAQIFPEFCIILDQAQDLVPIRGSVLGVHFVSDHLVDLYVFQNGQFILYNSLTFILLKI